LEISELGPCAPLFFVHTENPSTHLSPKGNLRSGTPAGYECRTRLSTLKSPEAAQIQQLDRTLASLQLSQFSQYVSTVPEDWVIMHQGIEKIVLSSFHNYMSNRCLLLNRSQSPSSIFTVLGVKEGPCKLNTIMPLQKFITSVRVRFPVDEDWQA